MAEGVAWDAYTLIETGANATWQIAADAADAAYNNDMDIAEDDWNLAHSDASADYDLAESIAEADWYVAEDAAWTTYEGAMIDAESEWDTAEEDAWNDYTSTGSPSIVLASFVESDESASETPETESVEEGTMPIPGDRSTTTGGHSHWDGGHASFRYNLTVQPGSPWANNVSIGGYAVITAGGVKPGLPPGSYIITVDFWGDRISWTERQWTIVTGNPGQLGIRVGSADNFMGPLEIPPGGNALERLHGFLDSLSERELAEMLSSALQNQRIEISGTGTALGGVSGYSDFDALTQCISFAALCESLYANYPPDATFHGMMLPIGLFPASLP